MGPEDGIDIARRYADVGAQHDAGAAGDVDLDRHALGLRELAEPLEGPRQEGAIERGRHRRLNTRSC